MSFNRFRLLLIILAPIAGAVLCFLSLASGPPSGRGAYAVLITSAAIPDAELRERIAPLSGDFGGPPLSESSQWALLDEFDRLAKIPLDEYERRVTPGDPRNDGYAARLRSFFVRDGKRFVFIPQRPGAASGSLEQGLAAALGDIPFSLEYVGFGRPLALYVPLCIAASLALLPFWGASLPGRSKRLGGYGRHSRQGQRSWPRFRWLPFCLPVVAALTLRGAAGCALSALLLGLSALLAEPVAAFRERRSFRQDGYEPFRLRWLLAPLFPAAYTLVVICSGFSPPLALGVFCAHAVMFVCSQRIFSLPRSGGHTRFAPVLIMTPSLRSGFVSAGRSLRVMTPFVLAAVLALALAPRIPGVRSGGGAAFLSAAPVTEADYRAHVAFQASFSLRPLGRGEGLNPAGEAAGGPVYAVYVTDTDGLVSPVDTPAVPPPEEFPPFPLQALMDSMGTAKTPAGWSGAADGIAGIPRGELFAVLLSLLCMLPACVPRRRSGSERQPFSSPHGRAGNGLRRRGVA